MATPAASASHLARLPNEVFENILKRLDLASIKQLRHTSKDVSDKCIQPHFKSYYANQSTDLSTASLTRLNALAHHAVFGLAVKNITVDAILYDTLSASAHVHDTLSALAKVHSAHRRHSRLFSRLCIANQDQDWLVVKRLQAQGLERDTIIDDLANVLTQLGKLDTLALEGQVVRTKHGGPLPRDDRSHDFRELFVEASRVFRIVTMAVARSTVEIGTLAVFEHTPRCSVQGFDITEHAPRLQREKLAAGAGQHIKKLVLSFATRTDPVPPLQDLRVDTQGAPLPSTGPGVRLLQASDPKARADQNFPGVAALLNQIPGLEELDLHLYNTLMIAPWPYDKVFAHIAMYVKLPLLKYVTLRGLRASEENILLFLSNHPKIAALDIRDFRITVGSWLPIFDYLRTMLELTRVRLANISSGRDRLINLAPKDLAFDDGKRGSGYTFSTQGGDFRHTRDISAEEVREGIDLEPMKKGRQGSKLVMEWVATRRKAYGPP